MNNPFKVNPAFRTYHVEYAIRDIVEASKEAKKQGKELIYLNIGDPVQYGFKTPESILKAVCEALYKNYNSYSDSVGVPEAVDAIKSYALKKGIKPLDIYVTQGASEAIEFAIAALINPGENILLPCPCYPLYQAIVAKFEIEPRFYFLDEENNWEPDLDNIEALIDKKTKAIAIINPNNPTGAIYSKETLEKILEIAKKYQLVILSDEIYDQFILEENLEHISIASLTDEIPVITFNGLSKNYFAPGFRIGWGIISGPKEMLIDYIEAIHKLSRTRLCAPHPLQFAIPEALNNENGYIKQVIKDLRKRRDLLVDGLNQISHISCVKPLGAFYAFPRIDISDISDLEFTKRLILEEGVVVVHGSGFGQKPGTKHFRIIFLPEEEKLIKALEKIEKFVKKITS
ncbi:aminotransferase class I/II-fold pyridoxal phosphate-dependent enzyme [Thermodesulfobacterium hydrogeniphilum]|uniref:aminotransferase class I/II-fold pyridoxal phosphate-dependent enzyme n=1 Tax=Thermodesulfobacterium hydrogeniphilum TaxID=161156 RepID=UPI00056FDDCB|nr:aminotransferase class I/II-fold pyridoxal phosphate-dependent enzyme [Thermodesulfobacterium hydrogeniphilum]